MILTHISARYTDTPHLLEREAADVFPGTRVAWDGMTVEVEHADESEQGALR